MLKKSKICNMIFILHSLTANMKFICCQLNENFKYAMKIAWK